MQESKVVDFNPLNILATAAALQRLDGNTVADMTQQNSNDNQQVETGVQTSDGKTTKIPGKNVNTKVPGKNVCKLVKVMFSSKLDKMYTEHNYGNARKTKICPLNTDVSPRGKDRKVVVTLVDRSGDHHVLKTVQAVRGSTEASKGNSTQNSDKEITKQMDSRLDTEASKGNTGQSDCCLNKEVTSEEGLQSKGAPRDNNIELNTSCTQTDIYLSKEALEGNSSDSIDAQSDKVNKDINHPSTDLDLPVTLSNHSQVCQEHSDVVNSRNCLCISDINRHVTGISTNDPDFHTQPQTLVINISHKGDQTKGDNSSPNIPEVKQDIIRTLLTSSQIEGVKSEQLISDRNDLTKELPSTFTSIQQDTTSSTYSVQQDKISECSQQENSNSQDLTSSDKMGLFDNIQVNLSTTDSVRLGFSDDIYFKSGTNESDSSSEHLGSKGEQPSIQVRCKDSITAEQDKNSAINTCQTNTVLSCKETLDKPFGVHNINSQLVDDKKLGDSLRGDNCVQGDRVTMVTHIDPGVDHCYAGVYNNHKQSAILMDETCNYGDDGEMKQKDRLDEDEVDTEGLDKDAERCVDKEVDGFNDTESPHSVISDLSQDSGFSDSGQSPDVLDSELSRITRPSHMFGIDTKTPTVTARLPSPKVGKYRIGTFASVSNSAMGLESPKSELLSHLISNRRRPTLLLTGSHGNMSVKHDDVDGDIPQSGVYDKYSVPGTPVMKTDIEHDHDYCLPWVQHAFSVSNSPSSKLLREATFRESTPKIKERKLEPGDVKRRRVSSTSSDKEFGASTDEADVSSPDSVYNSPIPIHQPNTRHRGKLDKIAEYVKTGNSESKLKITGSFQDDYIYFLNTKSRSRRRTIDVKPQIPADKILIPLPKPGDIVVPHLTDADLEAIKQRRNFPKKTEIKPQVDSPFLVPQPLPQSVQTGGALSTGTLLSAQQTGGASGVNPSRIDSNGDDDSKSIIDTILSMENAESTSYVGTAPDPPTFGENFGLSFSTEQMNLTPEQMEILYSAMDEVSQIECITTTPKSDNVANEESAIECIPAKSDNVASEVSTIECTRATSKLDNIEDETNKFDGVENQSLKQNNKDILNKHDKDQQLPDCTSMPSSTSSPQLAKLQSVPRMTKAEMVTHVTSTQRDLTTENSETLIEHLKTSVSDKTGSGAVEPVVHSSDTGTANLSFTNTDTPTDKSPIDLLGNGLKLFPEVSTDTTATNCSSIDMAGGTSGDKEASYMAKTTSCTPVSTTNYLSVTSTVTSAVSQPSVNNEYDAPWIVTVSMYWNDLPAIMIDNLPYVRLVDIHKQILPAKDTGILKKRCQLLGFEVKNCSEMQRYFLVQYGKAFNSKSTLIVSKEDAVSLIGYYVNPIPKTHRTEHVDRPRLVQYNGSQHRGNKSHTKSRHRERTDSGSYSDPAADVQERILPQVLPLPDPPAVTRVPAVFPPSSNTVDPGVISNPVLRRTRHKKINFLELLKGDQNNNSEPQNHEAKSCKEEDEYKSNVIKGQGHTEKSKISKKTVTGNKRKLSLVKETKSSDVASETSQEENSCDESESESNLFDKNAVFINPKRKICSLEAKKARLDTSKKGGSFKVKWTIFNKSENKKKKLIESKHDKRKILSVIHKDTEITNGHRSRAQSGSVFLDQLESHDSACVRCCTCKQFFSIDSFLNHLHEVGGSGKLIAINQAQTLALRDMYPSEAQRELWKNFQEKLQCLKNQNGVNESELDDNTTLGTSSSVCSVQNDSCENSININKDRKSQHISNGTRVSSRKRKQKQLYPIENYSFSKSQPVRKCIESDEDMPMSPLVERCDTYDSSPVKRLKLDSNHNDSDTSFSGNAGCGDSVLTLTNGPEITSFTALADDCLDL